MAAPTILLKIAAERQADVDRARQSESLEALRARALASPAPKHSLAESLRAPGVSVIAEVKRASPSKGDIAAIPDPVAHARTYLDGGARAISCLTEPRHFKGHPDDLRAIAAALPLPVLRKDFLVDPYQVWEARAWGASAALLIVALLDTVETLKPMLDACKEAGIEALVETHDAAELAVAIAAGAEIVGVNHRNLHDFTIDTGLFIRLRPTMPEGIVTVAESGVHDRAFVQQLEAAGADAILVGEHLAKAPTPAEAIERLVGSRA